MEMDRNDSFGTFEQYIHNANNTDSIQFLQLLPSFVYDGVLFVAGLALAFSTMEKKVKEKKRINFIHSPPIGMLYGSFILA